MTGVSRIVRRIGLGLAAAIVAGCGGRAGQVQEAPLRPTMTSSAPANAACIELNPLVQPLVAERWVASASLALRKDGKTTLCSYGTAASSPASPDTLYEVGSLTKLFTGLLLAAEVERGAVHLGEPVSRLMPLPLQSPITLLDLATHRSGLPRMPTNFAPRDARNPYADYDEARLLEFLREAAPAPIGAQYQYSNLGAALVGLALAHRAQEPYQQLLREQVLAPLGMHDTYFALPTTGTARFAQGHDADDSPQPPWDFDALAPAGALRSSARDMAKLLGATETPLASAFAAAEVPRADARDGRRIGLFFQTREDGSVWHNGQTGGFASYFAADARSGVGVVLLLSTTFARADELGDRVLAYLRGQSVEPFELPPVFQAPAETLGDYAGDYDFNPAFALHVDRANDALFAQATGQDRFKLWPSAPDRFYLRVVDARISFERDEQGRVSALLLDQGGRQQRAARRN